MDFLINSAVALIPALIISVITALVTVQLSLRRFYAERWWDRKVEAYTSIFEALYRLKHYSDVKYEDNLAERKISEEHEKELEKQWREATMEIGKAIDIGSFTICHEAVACLRDFRARPRLIFHENSIFELAAEESKYLNDCITALKIIAAKDLKLKYRNANKAMEPTGETPAAHG